MNKEIGNVKEIMNQATVDSIAEIRAEKARLTEIENRLMDNIKMQGIGTYNGTEHYITVSEADRKTTISSILASAALTAPLAFGTNAAKVVFLSFFTFSRIVEASAS